MPAASFFRQIAALLFVFASLPGSARERAEAADLAASTPAAPSVMQAAEGRAAIRDGVSIERSRQWLKAIEHYEEALKRWPDSKDLQYGLRRSKIHYGIDRRYADGSFEQSLLTKSSFEAMNLLEDVLVHVRSNYVDPVSATSFIAHGTESFYLALANDKFTRRFLRDADPADVRQMREILREQYWNRPINDAAHARQTVDAVCERAFSLLRLPAAPVAMEYVFGGFGALDDYSNFLTPERLDDLYGNIEGEFVGLGIEMKAESGRGMLLVNVLPDSPAEQGGIRPGEHIIEVDGIDCRHMSTDEAARLLRGPPGSRVRLKLQHGEDGPARDGVFVRRAVHVHSIPVARIVDREHGIGYIRMTGFQKTSVSELDEALWRLSRQGMRSLIWDLRGNPGGLLTAAVEVLDRFVENGVLVSTRGRSHEQNWTYSARRQGTWNIPLVLLVDGESASASEIVAGAVKDHRRGTIVGRSTFGKWSVQSIFPIRNSSGLRLTTARFYSPSGRTLGKVGVRPDVLVSLDESARTTRYRPVGEIDPEADPDLRKGIEILQQQLTRR